MPIDLQSEPAKTGPPRSERNVAGHAGSSLLALGANMPGADQAVLAAVILNASKPPCILAGQGALGAGAALAAVAERLGAPVATALLGKGAIADVSPYATGGVGLLGTRPSQEALEGCDALLIVGSTFPYIEFYPQPGQARGVQTAFRSRPAEESRIKPLWPWPKMSNVNQIRWENGAEIRSG